ncbi:MAG: hypothetical protein Q6373_012770 [Candidatus Sigynarchaeota archaeon]
MGEKGRGDGRDKDRKEDRKDARPGGGRGPLKGAASGRRGRASGGVARRGRDERGFKGSPRRHGPRMEQRGNEFIVFVSTVEVFADHIIRKDYVEPALEKLNAGIDRVIFKAKGQAINVAVQAALLLETVMGAMHKTVLISADPGHPLRDRPDKAGSQKHDRLVASIEITMQRF